MPMITSSAQTTRPVFKPVAENNPRCPSRPIVPRTSSMRPFACYLTRWRMGIAVQLLEDTDSSRLVKRPPASALARAQPSVSGRRSDQLYS